MVVYGDAFMSQISMVKIESEAEANYCILDQKITVFKFPQYTTLKSIIVCHAFLQNNANLRNDISFVYTEDLNLCGIHNLLNL